jgi:hypothetical protein
MTKLMQAFKRIAGIKKIKPFLDCIQSPSFNSPTSFLFDRFLIYGRLSFSLFPFSHSSLLSIKEPPFHILFARAFQNTFLSLKIE